MLSPGDADKVAARCGTRVEGSEVTLQTLVQGYGIPLGRITAFEDMGIVSPLDKERYACSDDDRLIIAAAAVQLGFTLRELRELMALYDEASPSHRALPHFMKLLASYQRLMAWREPGTGDPTPTRRPRTPFRARSFRPRIVSRKESQ